MNYLIDGLSWVLLLTGSCCVIIGGVGVIRLPDFYTRLHAAGVTDTAGASLILLGLMLQGGMTLITVKLIMILIFLLISSPTASHALAKAALSDKLQPWQLKPRKKPPQEDSSSNP
ncbi:MAG: monovalent cation/H(+) antiporter subunit G [Gammaproteobacteria bacterium]